jgi:hypothetical protein
MLPSCPALHLPGVVTIETAGPRVTTRHRRSCHHGSLPALAGCAGWTAWRVRQYSREIGLTADAAIVLQNSNKLALRLLPGDVFALVVRIEQQVAQFEIELAQRLTGSGSPVAALEPRVEPRVYERAGFAVTLWTYCET